MGNVEILRMLLNAGANINAKDVNGRSALMMASKEGQADCVALLLSDKADPTVRDNEGLTAVDLSEQPEQIVRTSRSTENDDNFEVIYAEISSMIRESMNVDNATNYIDLGSSQVERMEVEAEKPEVPEIDSTSDGSLPEE